MPIEGKPRPKPDYGKPYVVRRGSVLQGYGKKCGCRLQYTERILLAGKCFSIDPQTTLAGRIELSQTIKLPPGTTIQTQNSSSRGTTVE